MTTHGQRLAHLASGQSIVVDKIPAGGSLEARRLGTGGIQFYWRHTENKRTEREPIGIYDSAAPPKALKPTARGYSVAAALERARELAKINADTPGGLRAERERTRAAQKAQEAAVADLEKHSLHNLCLDYVAWLKKQGKPSSYDALNIFTNHLIEVFPDTAAKPAAQVDKREIVEVVRKLTEVGKGATARKLRSYLRAAYGCAVKADSDATLPAAFISYNITSNPVEATAAIRGATDKNPLSAAELRKYWKALADEPGVIGAALRLHVVTAGQRTAQLVRLRDSDITKFTLQLLDPKGKRTEPRVHLLPITPAISTELALLPAKGFKLSTDDGKTPMHPTSLSTWAAEVAARAGIEQFQLKRVRSGIETLLAEARVSLQVRGQLQSHGIGGVQERSYDAYSYQAEKREALVLLYGLLNKRMERRRSSAGNTKPMPRKAAQ